MSRYCNYCLRWCRIRNYFDACAHCGHPAETNIAPVFDAPRREK